MLTVVSVISPTFLLTPKCLYLNFFYHEGNKHVNKSLKTCFQAACLVLQTHLQRLRGPHSLAPHPSSSVLSRPGPSSPPTASSHETTPSPQTPCLHPGEDSGPASPRGLAWGQVSPKLGIALCGAPPTQAMTLSQDLSRTTFLCERGCSLPTALRSSVWDE